MTWGVHGTYLIVAAGEGEVEAVEKRMQGSPPPWLSRIRKELPVPRLATIAYLDVKSVLEIVKPFVPVTIILSFRGVALNS